MGRRPTVLVVDDSPAYLRLVQYILAEAGERVVTARDGDEALSRAVHDQPDLIACDILLPRRDGLAVLQALKQRPETRDIPVYIFSSLGDEEYIAQAYAAGAVGYLVKPFTARQLLAVVERFAGRRPDQPI